MPRFHIRPATEADWPAIWLILEPVFRAGETYPYPRDIDEAGGRRAWMALPRMTCVAEEAGQILGTYYIKPNQPGQGSHVCNCGYVVSSRARGRGVASALCEHSQQLGAELGFRAMQFNLVVSTNTGAVRLWQKLGFEVLARLPGAFAHPREGDVDALVMYKQLG